MRPTETSGTSKLTITRTGFLSRDLEIRDGVAPIADIEMSSFRERAELRVGTELYVARRVGWVGASFVLERQEREVARAEAQGFFRRTYEVRGASVSFTLEPRGFFRTDYVLLEGSTEVGSIKRVGFWGHQIEASFPRELDRPLQVFVVWVVVRLWRRKAAAAAG